MKSVAGITWSNKKNKLVPIRMLLIENTLVHDSNHGVIPCDYAWTISKYGIRKSIYDPVINYWMLQNETKIHI